MKEAVLLASGGLDSTTLAYWLLDREIEFLPVFIDYGQHCANTELSTLREVLPSTTVHELVILDISDLYRGCSSRLISEPDLWKEDVSYEELYLPYRNLLLLSVGAAYAQGHGLSVVYSAFINSNHAQEIDCSTEFFGQLSKMLRAYGSVQIEMPFRNLSKYEVAKIGMQLQAPIAYTFSCQVSSTVPCGACPNCVDRLDALEKLIQKHG